MTAAAQYKALGTTTDHTTCCCCGKQGLKKTVILQFFNEHGDDEGAPVYYGTTCATKALASRGVNVSAAQLTREALAATLAARKLEQELAQAKRAANLETVLNDARRFAGKGQRFHVYSYRSGRPGFPEVTYTWAHQLEAQTDKLRHVLSATA